MEQQCRVQPRRGGARKVRRWQCEDKQSKGVAKSCKALIGEGTARKSGAKQRHGKELFRRGKAERNAVCWGMASNCLVLVLSTKKKGESMKKCSKGIKILAIVYVAVILFIIAATAVEAKEPTFKSLYVPEGEWNNGGHLFIVKGGVVQAGWTTYNGHLYYCHKTASEKYPIGAVTMGEIRTVGGTRWVAFNEKGWRVTKDQYISKGPHRKAKVLEFGKDGYLKYIYNTDMSFCYFRYSMKEHRRQEQNNGKWESVGMQYYPDCVDWQK